MNNNNWQQTDLDLQDLSQRSLKKENISFVNLVDEVVCYAKQVLKAITRLKTRLLCLWTGLNLIHRPSRLPSAFRGVIALNGHVECCRQGLTLSNIDPRLQGFILFCVARRGNKWPALYDEIAIVAGQRLYHGMGYAELRQMGLCLGLENIEKTRELIRLATAPCG